MKKTILVILKSIEENIKRLEINEEVLNYVENDFVMNAGGNTKLFIFNLISGNDYNCYCVSGDCSCLYKGHSDKLTFSDKDVCINYLEDEIKELDDNTLEITLNLVDDESGCDYDNVVYEFLSNKIAQYYKKVY